MNLGVRDLLRRHLLSRSLMSVVIGVLVALTVFVVAAAPRALAQLGTAELAYELGQQPPAQIDLTATGTFGLESSAGESVEDYLGPTALFAADVPGILPPPLADGAGESSWILRSRSVSGDLDGPPVTEVTVSLAVDLSWTDRIRVVDGTLPGQWLPPTKPAIAEPVEIAISQDAADAMEVKVGDQLTEAGYRIAAIYEPLDAEDPYWRHARDLLQAAVIREPGSPLRIQAAVYVNPETAVGLGERFSAGELSVWVPIDPDAYDFADAGLLADQARAVTASPLQVPDSGELVVRSRLDNIFDEAVGKVASTSALVALTASGFFGVLVATYALCIQSLIARRRPALALAAARGASSRQLRTVMTLETSLVAIPGAVIALLLAAILLPARVDWTAWVGPAIVGVIPVMLAIALTQEQAEREVGRDDLGTRSTGAARWVAEVAVLALAIVAVFLLQRRGLVESSAVVGIDPLLAATPLLLSAVVGLAVIRVFHLPLGAIHRWLKPRIVPASIVGSARAVREPAIGLVGTLTLVSCISIVVFTTVMISTVAAGLQQAARDQVGADLQIAAHDLPPSLVDDLVARPEIAAAAALTTASGVEFADEASPSEVTVMLVDTAALHAVRPDIPDLSGKVDGRLRILVSSDWAEKVDGTELHVLNSLAESEGEIAAGALPGVTRRWILVDDAAAEELNLAGQSPSVILARVAPGVDFADSAEAASGLVIAAQPDIFAGSVRVQDTASLLHQFRSAPIVGGLEVSLLIAALAALVLTIVVVVLSALSAATSRNRVIGVLRIVGMSPSQIRRIVAWEFAPVTIAAVVVGASLGIALPYLVTSVLDLRSFVGGNLPPQPVIDPVWVGGAVGIFVVGVVLAAVAATAAGRRFAPAGTLKMGEE